MTTFLSRFRSQGQEEGRPSSIHPGAEAEGGGAGAVGVGRDRDARPQGARRRQDRARAFRTDRPAEVAFRPAEHQNRRGRRPPHLLARVAPLQARPRPPLRRPSALNDSGRCPECQNNFTSRCANSLKKLHFLLQNISLHCS